MNEERGGTNLCFFQVKKKNRRRRPERERVLKFFQEPSTSLFVESTSIICGEYSHGMLHFPFQTLYLGLPSFSCYSVLSPPPSSINYYSNQNNIATAQKKVGFFHCQNLKVLI